MKKTEKVLNRSLYLIEKYKGDSSKTYSDLKKTYNKYQKLNEHDRVTNELYIKTLDELNQNLIMHHNYLKMLITMLIFLIISVGFTLFSCFKYYDLKNNLEDNIIKGKDSSLIVTYKDINDFNAVKVSNEENYMNLTPITLSMMNKAKDNKNTKRKYQIYLIEQNKNIDNHLLKDVFLYNVKSDNGDNGINYLKYAPSDNNRILLYEGIIDANNSINFEIRMWIDNKIDNKDLNKNYYFLLDVKSQEID